MSESTTEQKTVATLIKRGDDMYVCLGSLYPKVMSQSILRVESPEFPMETVERWISQKKRITFVEYGENHWIISGTRFQYDSPEYSEEQKVYVIPDEFPRNEIVNAWEMQLRISLLNFCNGKWILITVPQKEGSGVQSFIVTRSGDVDELKSEIKNAWDNSKKVEILIYANQQWILILSQDTGSSGQSFYLNSDWPMEKIKSYYAESKYLQNLVWNDDEKFWALIVGDVGGGQALSTHAEYPSAKLETWQCYLY